MKLAIYSKGIWQIPNLAAFLPEYELVFAESAEAVAGWGLKPTTKKARRKAAEQNIPYIALEDGFLRSYDLGVNGAAPLSIVVDRKGIYYDATRESELEDLIKNFANAELLERAKKLIAEIKAKKLSKYNCFIDEWKKPVAQPCVLVIDQCYGDASITYGKANQESFDLMIKKAREENPNHHLLIKTHPDVAAGKRKGYIKLKDLNNYSLITENINPHTLFENVDKVYVVTSLSGFEALMHNIPVRCFGLPFYAGWGATIDEQECERRNVKRSAEEIFASAYLQYARYVNPFTGEKCEIEDVIDIIAEAKKYFSARKEDFYCVGFSKWKRHFIKPYLKSPFNEVKFFYFQNSAIRKAKAANGNLVVWAAREKPDLMQSAGGQPIWRIEDGFIRSVGLGSDFIAANSLSIDNIGMHFNQTNPSKLENILNDGKFTDEEISKAKEIRELILKKAITKYNTEKQEANIELPKDKKLILAVGQVEGDASIRLGSPNIKTNQELIDAIRENNPDAYIIYKPHPDVMSGNRKGGEVVDGADKIISNVGIHSLIKLVDEVHTITSLVGFESLLHGKKVFTYGMPFYAGWGLTHDKLISLRRIRAATLDELVVATLIKYPSYYDFEANLPCKAEVIINKISRTPLKLQKNHLVSRITNGIYCLFK